MAKQAENLARMLKLRDQLRTTSREKIEQKEEKGIQLQKEYKNIPLTAPSTPTDINSISGLPLNEKQLEAVGFANSGREFVLIGAAGSGKTTTTIEIIPRICKKFGIDVEKAMQQVAVIAYTRRAARNSAKNLKQVGAGHLCKTAHKFLGYHPQYFDYVDEEGNTGTKMEFVPKYTKENPINECKLVVIEEASMLDYHTLYQQLREACPNATFIYIGDLNQLFPVFGKPTLGYKINQLPVIELTHIYRQALESPIIHFQHNYTLKGLPPSEQTLAEYTEKATPTHGLEFVPFKKDAHGPEQYNEQVAQYIISKLDAGEYCPEQDTILIPFNKKFGSTGINEHIAQHLGERRGAIVWEVICGFEKKYLAVGDFVLYEKNECKIIEIEKNPRYTGAPPRLPSENLLRNGGHKNPDEELIDFESLSGINNFNIEINASIGEQREEKVNQASAIVTVEDTETGEINRISTVGELAALDFGYCMSIHKAQGSEWRKVWLIMHKSHAVMLSRELIYTGMTRAKDKLTVLYSPQKSRLVRDSTVAKAVQNARIPGKSWQEKAKAFQDKIKE